MDEMIPPELIETARLTLRPWQLDDVEDLFDYASDEEWGRFLPVPRPYTHAHAEQFVARQILIDRSAQGAWAVVFEDAVVGSVDLWLHVQHARATMGWSIAKRYWGQGFATEAASAVIDASFSALADLRRIVASADPTNVGSVRVMEKIGMKREGLFREHQRTDGRMADEVWYAILRSEWSPKGSRSGGR